MKSLDNVCAVCIFTSNKIKLRSYRPLSHHVTTNNQTHLATQTCKQLCKQFPNAGDNTEFTDFNTQCCPKIRLRCGQKASHCTLVLLSCAILFLKPIPFYNMFWCCNMVHVLNKDNKITFCINFLCSINVSSENAVLK